MQTTKQSVSNSPAAMDFIAYSHTLIQRKQQAAKVKTATNYMSALRTLACFLNHEGRAQVLPFPDLTSAFAEHFEAFLLHHRHITRNTSSSYMRSLQAIWGEAVKDGLATAGVSPFARVYTGVDRTRHRAARHAIMRQLLEARLDSHASLVFARDMFLFSFLARGMAFIDMAKLRKDNVHADHISYVRSKTSQVIVVPLTTMLRRIIRRWEDPVSPYMLPIIQPVADAEPPFSYRLYDNALHRYNRNLRLLSKRLGIAEPLTSYTARHTWASEAYRLQVPVSVISACMGHTSEATTRIYLKSLSTDYIDAQAAVVEDFYLKGGAAQ
ncbi:MAG: site-specific integrase [Prevotella sp.]|nr:site-specific integrase [Prevotella sp.]